MSDLALELLKDLLSTSLTKEQENIIINFLKINLIRDELTPIKERIERKVQTNLKAMPQDILQRELFNYLRLDK